jgi:hypothetical protein
MTHWHASYELRLTAAGLAAIAAKSLRTEVEAEMCVVGLDTSG